MQCKKCEYYLWGVRDRYCPECHTAFLPSESEFLPNTVRFCCPYCNHACYGTDEKGHLAPRHFVCVSCGQPVDMDEMVLFPAEGVAIDKAQVERMPWLDRKRQGAVKAWFRTIRLAMTSPSRLMRMTPLQASSGQAWLFAIVSNLLFVLIGIVPFIALEFFVSWGTPFSTLGGCGLLIPLLVFITGLSIWAVVAHVILKITGETAGGSSRTLQALCYGSAPNVISAIPYLGIYLSPVSLIWTAISTTLMVREGQKVHGARAALAVLTFPTIIIALLVGTAFRTNAQFNTLQNSGYGYGNVYALNESIRQQAATNGSLPQHAIELLDSGSVSATNLVILPGTEDRVAIGDTTLAQFETMSAPQAAVVVQATIKSLPPGVIAHRLGDYVFTYHGINVKSPDPRLWLVVCPPNPRVPSFANGTMFLVGQVDGRIGSYTIAQFPAELAKQNAIRAKYGLAPLPDPGTVTQMKPAVGLLPPTSGPAGGAATSAPDDVSSTQPQPSGLQ